MTEIKRWNDFLQTIAVRLGIDKQPKNFFEARFTLENLNITDDEFIEWLRSEEAQKNHPRIYSCDKGNYAKQMTAVYASAGKECSELKNPKNVNDKKNILGAWLKNQYIQWIEEQKKEYGNSSRHQQTSQNWHEICYDKLEHWRKRNIDLFIGNNRLNFDNIDRTFVPLGLWKKLKKEDPQAKNTDRQQNPQVERYEITQKFECQQDFLDKIIHRGSAGTSSKEKGQKLAIIGETGSGKTTLLLQIGFALLKQPENTVIWISLKEVRDRKISIWEYILDDWLKGSEVSNNEWKQEFENKLRDSCVWLLLDGLEDIPDRIYSVIGQFDEWINKPKIALTCRKSRWDSDKTDFEIFEYDIYECLGYNSDQPSNFIDAWFGDDSESANLLKLELQQATRHRINDLIKYPLYLSLLCSIYEKSELNFAFATTKAELFDQFIKRLYKRKITKDRFDADLVKSLGELAIKAIDTQGQLTDIEVKEKLGDRLEKALGLGWLKPIDEHEELYDFLHDSFKEYFAALAINDWDFFLPKEHIDKPLKDNFGEYRKYRIFDEIWRDVIIIWIGRLNIDCVQKKLFFSSLSSFRSGCITSFTWKAKFLYITLLAEYNNIENIDEICNHVIEFLFYEPKVSFENKNKIWVLSNDIARDGIRIIQQSKSIHLVKCIEIILAKEEKIRKKCDLAKTLLEIDPNNKISIDILTEIITSETLTTDRFRRATAQYVVDKKFNIPEAQLYVKRTENKIKEIVSALSEHFIKCGQNLIDTVDSIHRNASQIPLPSEPTRIMDLLYKIYRSYEENEVDTSSYALFVETAILNKIVRVGIGNIEIVNSIIDLISIRGADVWGSFVDKNYSNYIDILKIIVIPKNYFEVISLVKEKIIQLFMILGNENEEKNSFNKNHNCYEDLWSILLFFMKDMKYPLVYEAWNGKFDDCQKLESYLIDCTSVQEYLDRFSTYPKIHCLVINITHLENEIDRNLLSKRIWNGLQKHFPDSNLPRVNDIGDLEYELNQRQKQQGKKLAIALYCREETEAIAQLCRQIAISSIHIRSFPKVQTTDQLIAQIQAWLSETFI
ncbi:hypothetical protein TUMEXPCC7403_06765 [Tumidithrix helvetica PCC 7403]|uniref:NACHT domain-containing protein n=1 Tax=Tumidithrix helvetica TaxID=3457545 RepID=UPI003C934196